MDYRSDDCRFDDPDTDEVDPQDLRWGMTVNRNYRTGPVLGGKGGPTLRQRRALRQAEREALAV